MSSTTYPIDTPRWLWQLFKRAIDDGTDYDKYNDRLVEAIAVDVQRFDQAGLLDLDDFEQQRIRRLVAEVQPDDETVPGHADGVQSEIEPGGDPSSTVNPRGESSR